LQKLDTNEPTGNSQLFLLTIFLLENQTVPIDLE